MITVLEIFGDATEARFAGRRIDRLPVAWSDAAKSRLRLRTEAGEDVGITLQRGSYLHHGGVLADDGDRIIVVERVREEVLIARFSRDLPVEAIIAAAVRLGHAFGNQHVPVEVDGNEVRIPITTSRQIVADTVNALNLTGLSIEFGQARLGSERPFSTHSHAH